MIAKNVVAAVLDVAESSMTLKHVLCTTKTVCCRHGQSFDSGNHLLHRDMLRVMPVGAAGSHQSFHSTGC